MIAQYYPDEKIVRLFHDHNSNRLMDIPAAEMKAWGFPPFKKWQRRTWGYELEFRFEVTASTVPAPPEEKE